MRQPVNKSIKIKDKTKKSKKEKTQEQLDGSGLETFFRINILDKLGISYDQQFEAKSIGRFYDFHLKNSTGLSMMVLLEINGTYWHSDPRVYDKPINAIQKRNIRVDKIKDAWALRNGYMLIKLWEIDIKKQPDKIIKLLIEKLQIANEVVLLNESKKNGSFFMKNN